MKKKCCVCSLLAAASSALVIGSLLVPSAAYASAVAVGKSVPVYFRAGSYVKATRLAAMTSADLRFASRSENIAGLFRLAGDEGRLDPVTAMQTWGRYNALQQGDWALLKCLKLDVCNPETFVEIAHKSELHRQVMIRNPALDLTRANHAVGEVNEQVMRRFFEESGWKRVDGQVGRSGVDGLFVKVSDTGEVRDVLVVEAKYNTGMLADTNHGMQMSRDWLTEKIRTLSAAKPESEYYRQIADRVDKGFYRSRLWTMRIAGDEMQIDLMKVRSTAREVELVDEISAHIPQPPARLSVSKPSSSREKIIVESYMQALNKVPGQRN